MNPIGVFNGQSDLVKLIVVVVIIVLGFSLYSRWTGKSFGPVNLLGQNALGPDILAAQARWQARVQGRLNNQVHQQ